MTTSMHLFDLNFSSYSEAKLSESPENLEDYFFGTTCIVMCVTFSNHTSMLPVFKGLKIGSKNLSFNVYPRLQIEHIELSDEDVICEF